MAVVMRHVRQIPGMRSQSKYHNQKVKLDGHTFDSKKEANRFLKLLMMQNLGEISGLTVHPRFPLEGF